MFVTSVMKTVPQYFSARTSTIMDYSIRLGVDRGKLLRGSRNNMFSVNATPKITALIIQFIKAAFSLH
jgi:hypothetical protein